MKHEPVKAVMLAAGVGSRLYGTADRNPPKSLLRFGGRTLLDRHVEILRKLGVEELVMVVGHQAERVAGELAELGVKGWARTVHNPDYRRGSMVSLWTARRVLTGGSNVLLMDADVLYHPALLERLLASSAPDCILLDREFEAGDEPVRLCLREGRVVEFRKNAQVACDVVGEWPGFVCLSPASAARLADACSRYVDSGRLDDPCEEALRDLMLAAPESFAVEEITGLPWIEIDFPEDLVRAEREILPRLP